MSEKYHQREGMLKANSLELADSLGENHSDKNFKHHHLSQEQKEKQDLIESKEKSQADMELDRKLKNLSDIFGDDTSDLDLEEIEEDHSKEAENIDVKVKIKELNANLNSQGLPVQEILETLISKFENEEAVSTWVGNWKNFRELHELAKSKPPKEREAISKIISKADFTSETAFNTSLEEISLSADISKETKREITLKFGTRPPVQTVKQMDSRLKKLNRENQKVIADIKTETSSYENLETELRTLNKKIKETDLSDAERDKLKADQEELKSKLKSSEARLHTLKETKKEEISLSLREGFKVVLTPKGKRQIQTSDSRLRVTLPSNRLPFSDGRNLQAVNFCFMLDTLNKSGLTEHLIKPNFKNGSTPGSQLRIFSNRIITLLGLNGGKILSQSDIGILNKDLLTLSKAYPTMTAFENLKALKIVDAKTRESNEDRLFKLLLLIRENRETESSLKLERIKTI